MNIVYDFFTEFVSALSRHSGRTEILLFSFFFHIVTELVSVKILLMKILGGGGGGGCGFTVWRHETFFQAVFSICGIVVSSSPAVRAFSSFWVTVSVKDLSQY